MKESLNTIGKPTAAVCSIFRRSLLSLRRFAVAAAEPLGGVNEQRNHKHYEREMNHCHNRDFGRMVLDPLTPRQPSGERKRQKQSPSRPQTSPESGPCCIAGIPQEMVNHPLRYSSEH
jgi:hypothetical protein